MDFLFILSIILLPFENLFFAPSAGWATISPIILFIYVLANFKYLKQCVLNYGKIITYLLLCLLPLSIINYIMIDSTYFGNVFDSLIPLVLGITNLFAFDIYFNQKKHSMNSLVKKILIAYWISLFIGLIQFVTIKLNISFLKDFFAFISKRNYLNMRKVQFTYTEPSYIGMHLFGVLLPIYYWVKDKKILKLIVTYTIIGILLSGSVKLILDIFVVIIINVIIKNIKNKKIIILTIIFVPVLIGMFFVAYNNNKRIQKIVDRGVYADGSLSSRYFRINAAVHGYQKNFGHFVIGYGLGNSIIPMRAGYLEAYREYKNAWKHEVDRIGDASYTSDSESLCFYTKFISEFGIISLILFFIYLFNLKNQCSNKDIKNYIWILLYLYIQFESYAFYTLWLYIVMLKINNQHKINNSIEKNNTI